MADEAFALSPISARGTLPSESDYDAIREAFMETARGRWFLTEFAKRNRTTDTAEVLEAVGRIEATLSATKDSAASLMGSLSSIRAAVRAAKVSAAEAMPRPGAPDADARLNAAREGTRTVGEIAKTLRECGADTRICDLLDTQVKAISVGQQFDTVAGSRKAVLAAFDVLIQRIEQLAAGATPVVAPRPMTEAPAPQAAAAPAEKPEASVTPLFRAPSEIAPVAPALADMPEKPAILQEKAATPAVAAPVAAPTPAPVPVTAPVAMASPAPAAAPVMPSTVTEPKAASLTEPVNYDRVRPVFTAEKMMATPPQQDTAVPERQPRPVGVTAAEPKDASDFNAMAELAVAGEAAIESARKGQPITDIPQATLAEAEDLAMLDLVAQEMGAPQDQASEDSYAAPQALAPSMAPAIMTAPVPPVAMREPEQPSLGAALIANGVISHPAGPANDALASIRRMSQAEKIAFFS